MHAEIIKYHSQLSSEDQLICNQLATIIGRELPEAESKIWHAHPVWFIDGNPVTGYSKLKNGIRLLFWSGQGFDEPELVHEGKFKAAEIRFNLVSEIVETDLVRWLQKSREIQWDYKNLVKRKGKLERLK